jgi:WD40 repeat protein
VLVLNPNGHAAAVESAFTPDSKRPITVSMDKTIRVWDVWERQSNGYMPNGPGDEGSLFAAAQAGWQEARCRRLAGC